MLIRTSLRGLFITLVAGGLGLGALSPAMAAESADLAITIDGPQPLVNQQDPDPYVGAGANVVYVVNLNNTGPTTAKSVVASLELPDTLTFDEARSDDGAQCKVTAGNRLTCQFPDLAADRWASVRVYAAIDRDLLGDVVLSGSVTSATPDPARANNSATNRFTLTDVADITTEASYYSLDSDNPDEVLPGGTFRVYVSGTNDGPRDSHFMIVKVSWPESVSYVDQGDRCTHYPEDQAVLCGIAGTHAPGESGGNYVDLRLNPDASGPVTVTASATAGEHDPKPANNTVELKLTAPEEAKQPKLAVTNKGKRQPGKRVRWTLTAANTGTATAAGVVLKQHLPAGLRVTAKPRRCTVQGRVVTCAFGRLAAERQVGLSIVTKIKGRNLKRGWTSRAMLTSATDPTKVWSVARVTRRG